MMLLKGPDKGANLELFPRRLIILNCDLKGVGSAFQKICSITYGIYCARDSVIKRLNSRGCNCTCKIDFKLTLIIQDRERES